MPAAIAVDRPAPTARRRSLADVVLGRDPMQRRAVKRLLLVSHAYVVIWILVGLSVSLGYSPPRGWLLIGYGIVGIGFFYIVLRSGWTLKLKDPLFCFPQLLFGIGSCTIGYALLPFGQGPALQVLFVLFVYDLHRLTPRQIALGSALAVLLLVLTALGMWMVQPDGVDLLQQGVNISMAVLVIPMLSVVGRAVRRVHMVQLEQKAQLDDVLGNLKTLSQRDALTGAINRRYLMELLDEELKRRRRTGRAFSVAMIDIDYFKRINDGFGHAVGDVVLQQLTALAQQHLRETDVLARWGGEEFLVMMPVTSAAEAGEVIERLRARIEQHPWQQHAEGLKVSFSSGVAEHREGETIEQAVERADAALYRAKEHGRNRVEQG